MDSAILKLIKKRKSTVNFSSEPIDLEILDSLFDAAQWAPSAYNAQPWRFIYARKEDKEYNTFLNILMEGNQEWAKNAPVLVLSIAEKRSPYNSKENIYAWHDTGMATSNLFIQAISLNIFVHPMGGFDRIKAQQELAIPDTCEPVAMLAIGYLGEKEKLPQHLKEREESLRKRKEINEFVFKRKWGN